MNAFPGYEGSWSSTVEGISRIIGGKAFSIFGFKGDIQRE